MLSEMLFLGVLCPKDPAFQVTCGDPVEEERCQISALWFGSSGAHRNAAVHLSLYVGIGITILI